MDLFSFYVGCAWGGLCVFVAAAWYQWNFRKGMEQAIKEHFDAKG